MKTVYAWTSILFLFSTNWLSSHFRVLFICLSPQKLWSPGVLEVQLKEDLNNRQLMWLAHLITATPGTLTVDIGAEKRSLTIHLLESHQVAQKGMEELTHQYERNLAYAG